MTSIDHTKHTPGPWAWYGNAKHQSIYLATKHSGRRFVMGFDRWGMRGAQPLFQIEHEGMVPASDLVTFEVGDRGIVGVPAAKRDPSVYRLDIAGVAHPDARLIAAAPDMADYIRARAAEGCPEAARLVAKAEGRSDD